MGLLDTLKKLLAMNQAKGTGVAGAGVGGTGAVNFNPITNAYSAASQMVNPTVTGQPIPSVNPLQDYWKQPVVAGMPRDQFAYLAGSIAKAIAPNSWVGRVGAAAAAPAGMAYSQRLRNEYATKQPFNEFYKAELAKGATPEQAIKGWLDLNKTTPKSTYQTVYNPQTKQWETKTAEAPLNGRIPQAAQIAQQRLEHKGAPKYSTWVDAKTGKHYRMANNDKRIQDLGLIPESEYLTGKRIGSREKIAGMKNKGSTSQLKKQTAERKRQYKTLTLLTKTILGNNAQIPPQDANGNFLAGDQNNATMASIYDQMTKIAEGGGAKAKYAKKWLGIFDKYVGVVNTPQPQTQGTPPRPDARWGQDPKTGEWAWRVLKDGKWFTVTKE